MTHRHSATEPSPDIRPTSAAGAKCKAEGQFEDRTGPSMARHAVADSKRSGRRCETGSLDRALRASVVGHCAESPNDIATKRSLISFPERRYSFPGTVICAARGGDNGSVSVHSREVFDGQTIEYCVEWARVAGGRVWRGRSDGRHDGRRLRARRRQQPGG